MRRDLIIGILASLLLHGGVGFGHLLFKKKNIVEKPKEEASTIEIVQPPPPPPEEVETVDLSELNTAQDAASALAPPSLVDLPGVVQIDSFTQQLQPPPPPSLGKPTGVMNIPPGRPGTGTVSGKGLGDVFSTKDLDQQPQKRGIHPDPVYPFEMKRAGINGSVTVKYVIDYNGDVRDVQVIKSTQREFEANAIQGVLKWKFKPGKKGGKPVNTVVYQEITFNLNEE